MRSPQVQLDHDETTFLAAALLQWGGPAPVSQPVASLLGFSEPAELAVAIDEWRDRLSAGGRLTGSELRLVVEMAVIVVSSDWFGAGVDWETVSGLSDSESFGVIRRLQRKAVAEESQ